ncbi:hypothetical protein CKM354_001224300 [Cercospora kikuchii]|uniref:Glycoside hydrolase family 30 protein n=1 Tax=Cercospora kikuchii TaxID=84275 RepID=A0A9P3FLL7_9PEZI|nr:uncharacterized protein CKM354_001224300 [Cercospora kikuchii]GIZ49208.1 hypothetical protein CKM354_001224300 [Cercospora kikuchii]
MKPLVSLIGVAVAVSAQTGYGNSSYGNTSPNSADLTFQAKISINVATRYQTMVGGGCSGAFGAACTTNTLSAADQQAMVETLFSENIGVLSILRNLIGSSQAATILPSCPATPDGPFNYTFPANNDSCQLTLTQTAVKYNPDLFLYADAWSAPGCFKTTGLEAGGGYLCGVRRSNCTYDWREAYANYLIEYVNLYQQRGINVSLLGAYNEPDFNPFTYSAMLSDGYQAYDFLSVFYPLVKKAFPNLAVSCCDSTGARQQRDLVYELGRLPGGLYLFDYNTYHNYRSSIKRPFDDLLHGQPTIETECDASLILVNGTSYQVSARLWAFAGYFRFARPGAVRVEASSDVEEVYVTAWENRNGSLAIPVVNAAHYAYTLDIDLKGLGIGINHGVPYLTDNQHNVSMTEEFVVENGGFRAVVEPRSMKTFFLDRR